MRPFYRNHRRVIFRSVSRPTCQPWRFGLGLCWVLVSSILLIPVVSCGHSASHSEQGSDPSASGFQIKSAAFQEGAIIPRQFTCEGEDISPPLTWTEPPSGTHSFALIVEDPDAPGGVWTHWVVYNLPAGARSMSGNVPKQDQLPSGALQGLNSFGHFGYGGPCPPPGKAHHYFFRLYALDAMLSLSPGAAKRDVLEAAKGHILGEAKLMGRFKR